MKPYKAFSGSYKRYFVTKQQDERTIETICECFDYKTARRIAKLLNVDCKTKSK